jgi:hypothetical protein
MIGDAIKKYGEDEGRTELRIEESWADVKLTAKYMSFELKKRGKAYICK